MLTITHCFIEIALVKTTCFESFAGFVFLRLGPRSTKREALSHLHNRSIDLAA